LLLLAAYAWTHFCLQYCRNKDNLCTFLEDAVSCEFSLAKVIRTSIDAVRGDCVESTRTELAGATVLRGPMGFGKSSHLHTAKILRLSMDLPIVIEIVDTRKRLMHFTCAR